MLEMKQVCPYYKAIVQTIIFLVVNSFFIICSSIGILFPIFLLSLLYFFIFISVISSFFNFHFCLFSSLLFFIFHYNFTWNTFLIASLLLCKKFFIFFCIHYSVNPYTSIHITLKLSIHVDL